MQREVFSPLTILLFFLMIFLLLSCRRYEGHKSLLPIQQEEQPLGSLFMIVDLNMIAGTRKAKDKLIYEALLGRARETFGENVEIRNMVYSEKFKIFNLLVVEAAGDVVKAKNLSL